MPPANVVGKIRHEHPRRTSTIASAGALSIRHRIHHFAAAVHAVAARIIFRMAVGHLLASHKRQSAMRRLSDGWDHHVAEQVKIRTGNRRRHRSSASSMRTHSTDAMRPAG